MRNVPKYKRTGITAGFEPVCGGHAENVRVLRFVWPGVVRIPARNPFEEGAMLEPVNTVLKGIRRLSLLPGDNVLGLGLEGINVAAMDLLDGRVRWCGSSVPSRRSAAIWIIL